MRCLFFADNGNSRHPARYYRSNTGLPPVDNIGTNFCGFNSAQELLDNGMGVWQVTLIPGTTNKYIMRIRSGKDTEALGTRCLAFVDWGRNQYPERFYWTPSGGVPANGGDGACGLGSNLLSNKEAVWIIEKVPFSCLPGYKANAAQTACVFEGGCSVRQQAQSSACA